MHVKNKKLCAACIIRTKKSESHWQLLQILSIMLSTVKGGFGQNILTQFIEKLINFRDLYSFLNKIMWNFKCVKIFRKKWLFIEKYDELWDMFENRSKGYLHNSYIALRHSNGIETLHEKGIIIRQYCKVFDIFHYYTLSTNSRCRSQIIFHYESFSMKHLSLIFLLW